MSERRPPCRPSSLGKPFLWSASSAGSTRRLPSLDDSARLSERLQGFGHTDAVSPHEEAEFLVRERRLDDEPLLGARAVPARLNPIR